MSVTENDDSTQEKQGDTAGTFCPLNKIHGRPSTEVKIPSLSKCIRQHLAIGESKVDQKKYKNTNNKTENCSIWLKMRINGLYALAISQKGVD